MKPHRQRASAAPGHALLKSLSRERAELRAFRPWVAAVSHTAQMQALIDLDRAYANFFEGRAGYPRVRQKG